MVSKFFEDEGNPSKMKRAVFAGAAEALRRKKEPVKVSDEEIIQYISDNVEEIIEKID